MSRRTERSRLVIALSGGIGGAKLALGLSRILPADDLMIVANTGDDFEHLGLSISPDLDTLMYTLAGVSNPETGWGRRDETWNFMSALEGLGGETWFQLGDRDLATHVERTRRLGAGELLSQITGDFARRFGLRLRLLPMSDDPVRTQVRTSEGWLEFQDYFVRRRCEPAVLELAFAGAAEARPHPEVIAAFNTERLRAVLICPSNPFISVDPILAVPGLRTAIEQCGAPVVGVSPIIGNRAVKGPTAKMMGELGHEVTAAAVARHYGSLLDGYILDHEDQAAVPEIGVRTSVARTLMVTLEDREELASHALDLADDIGGLRPIKAGQKL